MILQTIEFLQTLADLIGAILIFLKPIITPIGAWMTSWITTVIDFLQENFMNNLTIFIVICVILVLSGIIVNIIWPGDIKGTTFSKGIKKVEEIEEKFEITEDRIEDTIRRCQDCGNPIGDADVCPLCGARN